MNSKSSLTDPQLLDLIKSGDEKAFGEVYERYFGIIYIHALKMLGDEDDAKDLVQEVFTTLWIKGFAIGTAMNLSGYLYITARNKVINLIRQNKVRKDYLTSLAHFGSEVSNTTLEQLNVKDLANAVEREIQSLPYKMREIFELSRKENMSHKEIALQLKISDKTVKKQISNALKIIRLRLNIFVLVFGILTCFLLRQ